jgi:paraquat-inducible protein B
MTQEVRAPQEPSNPGNAPEPVIHTRREGRISWIWFIPLVALLVGVSLLARNWLAMGPTVYISFETAEGLEVGQTKVRYKDVTIGTVTDIRVAEDRSKVLVKAELVRDGSEFITRQETKFWVVRPRLGLSGVSGLGTLVSGAYIAVDAPEAEVADDADPVYNFVGLEKPPEITSGRPGTRYTLRADDLGSLEIGSPVYYRRIQVGTVIGYDLDKSGKSVNVQVFVDAPNDRFVTSDTRFWNASGINLSLDADGFNVQTGSLVSMVAGGVAFASADESNTEQAAAGSAFELAPSRVEAMADPDGPPFAIEFHFHQSVRGLKVGAPVDFRGLELGRVVDVDLEFNRETKRFYALVKAVLYPLRFGAVYDNLVQEDAAQNYQGGALLGPLVEHGLRAQIRPANILTGQQYVALDFFPQAEATDFDAKRVPVVLPTIAGSFDKLQQQISSIVAKIDALPFDGIASDLRASLSAVTKLLDRLESDVSPQASATMEAARKSLVQVEKLLSENSPMNNNIDRTLRELNNAAKSLRGLADYLQSQPSALIRGKGRDAITVTP